MAQVEFKQGAEQASANWLQQLSWLVTLMPVTMVIVRLLRMSLEESPKRSHRIAHDKTQAQR
eukprot:6186867-Pleurochrysis_carterae.AAC.4